MEPNVILPKAKQTLPGLYLTALEAFENWKAEPVKVKIIDVRTMEEALFVGHAPMAYLVPVAEQTYVWDENKQEYPFKLLPDFVERVTQIAQPEDYLAVMCRSGGRSAIAINLLANAGFLKVYQIIDGMEGDSIKDAESVFNGKRMRNGWKNSNCPWVYKLSTERVVLKNKHSTSKT